MTGGITIVGDQELTSRKITLTTSSVDVLTDESTSSTSYTNLSTSGPAITLSPGVTQTHSINLRAGILNAGGNAFASVAVAGATAIDDDAVIASGNGTAPVLFSNILASSQTSGATHTMKYKANASTMHAFYRRITGICL